MLHILKPCTCCSPLLRASSSVCDPRACILFRLRASLLLVGRSCDLSAFSWFTSLSASVGILSFFVFFVFFYREEDGASENTTAIFASRRPINQSVLDDKASILFPVGHSSHISLGVRKDENSTCT